MRTALITIFVITQTVYGQKQVDASSSACVKNFLSGDFPVAEKYISNAIASDTNNLDYYFIRATIRLYSKDTMRAFDDFIKGVSLKKNKNIKYSDSLVHAFVKQEPKHSNDIESKFSLDPDFEKIQLGVWSFLYQKNKNGSFTALRNVQTDKPDIYRKLADSVCK